MLKAQVADIGNLQGVVDNGVNHLMADEATMNSLATEFVSNEIA
jgi:hypothetical protein